MSTILIPSLMILLTANTVPPTKVSLMAALLVSSGASSGLGSASAL